MRKLRHHLAVYFACAAVVTQILHQQTDKNHLFAAVSSEFGIFALIFYQISPYVR